MEPMIYYADDIRKADWPEAETSTGAWVLARPLGYRGGWHPRSIRRRLKVAIRVFKGELDALKWQKDQEVGDD